MKRLTDIKNKKLYTIIFSVISAAVMCLLIFFVFHFAIPNPNMILIIALVFFTGAFGVIPGAVSTALMIAYSMFFFSVDHSFFTYTDENAKKIFIILLGGICCFIIVSLLRYNRDKNHKELIESNEELKDMNKYLEEKSKADARVAELSQSVTSLLTNMPALTFSKDISTGQYLACNQLFAEYAHKSSPDGVVGLTDHEIFDKATADHFVEDDRIALSQDEPYIFFEDVPDAAGYPRHFQTTKQKFTDQQGRLCTLGMCVDVSELVNMKREAKEIQQAFEKTRYESVIYSNIAGSLSGDYEYVYYVDLDTDEYVEYQSGEDRKRMSAVNKSEDFFAKSYINAQTMIYEKDRADFLASFSKENIIRVLDEQNRFNLVYRLMIDGKPQYVNMKVRKMKDDDRHIVIGVSNIDQQIKERQTAARLMEEKRAFSRINALSEDFIVIYSVDPETCQYQEYSSNNVYDELGVEKKGNDFFSITRKNAQRTVYFEDIERFTSMFTRANVLREINSKGIFSMKYRLLLERKPVYVRLKAALIDENDETRLIVGVINISEQVRQDQEYEYHISLARTLANRDELTGVKNKHAYAEEEREINLQIEGEEPVDFAVIMFDVNELKYINDTKGHQAGDEYLKKACSLICDIFKHSPVFRIGGDEFVIIARGQDYEHAEELICELEQKNKDNLTSGDVVIACGIAKYNGERNVAAVFDKADKLMYENKKNMKMQLKS